MQANFLRHWYSFTASFHYLAKFVPRILSTTGNAEVTCSDGEYTGVCFDCDRVPSSPLRFHPFSLASLRTLRPCTTLLFHNNRGVYGPINTIPRGSRFVGQAVAEPKSRLDFGVKNFPVTSYTVYNAELYI